MPTPCWWVPGVSKTHDFCYAQPLVGVETYDTTSSYPSYPSEAELDMYFFNTDDFGCRPTAPSGTLELSVTSLVVALGSQLVEAVVGFKYLVNPRRPPTLMTVVTLFEALGVALIATVVIALPGFFDDEFFGLEKTQRDIVFSLTWAAAATAMFGAVIEWRAELPDRWGERHSQCGAVGNALVWLGAATLEVVVAAFQTWRVTLSPGWVLVVNELAGLVFVEVLALLSMWIARFLWIRSKQMLSPLLADGAIVFRRQRGSNLSGFL